MRVKGKHKICKWCQRDFNVSVTNTTPDNDYECERCEGQRKALMNCSSLKLRRK